MSSSGLQSVMFDMFSNMGKSSLRLCEKIEKYLLGSHLDWREQLDINKSIVEETCRQIP